MAEITFTADEEYEREITFEIADTEMTLTVIYSEIGITGEYWDESGNEPDYSVRWDSAKVTVKDGFTAFPLWESEITQDDLNVSRNYVDAEIYDALDEIATGVFLEACREGEIA